MGEIISTGQGGAIITNDDVIADKIRKLKDFGRIKGGIDIHDFMGYNFKFTDIQACVGVEQMKKLPLRVERKKEIYRLYKKLLENTPQVTFFDQELVNTTPWFIDALVENRKNLIAHLASRGIGSREMYPPINIQKIYQDSQEHPVSNQVGEKGCGYHHLHNSRMIRSNLFAKK